MPNWELKQFASAAALAEQCATDFLAAMTTTPSRKCVAVSGGRIAKDFFSAIARHPALQRRSLAQVHFFWADERCVAPEDAESNYRSAAELLFAPLQLSPENVHRIRGEAEPESAARAAEAELRRVAPANAAGLPVLDLVLLGMGEDGHVASLFPGEDERVTNSPAIYRVVTASKPPPRRITISYASLAAAREVWVLASGVGKEAALRESLSSTGKTSLARVIQEGEQTTILTDLAL